MRENLIFSKLGIFQILRKIPKLIEVLKIIEKMRIYKNYWNLLKFKKISFLKTEKQKSKKESNFWKLFKIP